MGTLDFFLTRHHEHLAHWSSEAQAAMVQGRDAVPIDVELFSGSTRTYAEALASWQEAARQLRLADQKQADFMAAELEQTREALAEAQTQWAAISKSQAIISFEPDGTIIDANKRFLKLMGYHLEDVKGQHHRMFVDPAERDSPSYSQFWERLRHGQFDSCRYKRVARDGRDVWIEASYNPVLDADGTVLKVVMLATVVHDGGDAGADAGAVSTAVGAGTRAAAGAAGWLNHRSAVASNSSTPRPSAASSGQRRLEGAGFAAVAGAAVWLCRPGTAPRSRQRRICGPKCL